MSESRIYSIGHSNHPIEKFLHLLEQHRIEVLVDVRSTPASRFAPQFGHARLRTALVEAGRDYVFLGKELGGRPDGEEYYDEDGRVLYGRRAEAPDFVAGIERLVALSGASGASGASARRRVAMLCAEENPESCHRRLLVTRMLARRGIAVDHIRGDGRLQADAELAPMEDAQGGLFDDTGDAWRSKHPVKPSKPRQ